MEPEGGIVNLYSPDSSMGGHRDDAELTMDEPVVSFSLGCDAIFLLGGSTRAESPVPLRLHSGDVLLMGGPARLAFHGIACTIPHTSPSELFSASREVPCGEEAGEGEDEERAHIRLTGEAFPSHPGACGLLRKRPPVCMRFFVWLRQRVGMPFFFMCRTDGVPGSLDEERAFHAWMQTNRINVNIRQVFPGKEEPASTAAGE